MLYNNLIFFLGLYSWNIKKSNFIDKIISKKNINYNQQPNLKNNKKIIEYIERETNVTPSMNFYLDLTIDENLKNKNYVYYYNIYSFLIFLYLCIEPIYLIYNLINNNYNYNSIEEWIVVLLININNPVHYIWGKYYFSTNHIDLFKNKNVSCSAFNNQHIYTFFLIFIVILNIGLNFLNINSFYNEFYWIYYLPKYLAYPLIIIEWIFSKFIYALTTTSFTIVFCKHINDIKKFIKQLGDNSFDLEDSYCLSNLISKIANLRHSVEISIEFFNNIFSFLTITSGISFGILIRHKFNNLQILEHEIYLIQSYVLSLSCQIIFFYNVIIYSIYRTDLLKFIQSSSFVNKFLTRWTRSKLNKICKENTNEYISKMILCIEEENATTLDWLILDKLLKTKWMDFSIMGISTQDGSLIKKIIALSSIGYLILSNT